MALLGPGDKLITLADELESFFYVFLCYALRHVTSLNCDGQTIANFLDDYFDLYGFENGMYTCGALKTATVKRGKIDVGSQTLRCGNPLDALFKKIMSWFMAHYLILDYEKESAADATQAAKALPDHISDLRREIEDTNSDILAQFSTIESAAEGGPHERRDRAGQGLDEALHKTWLGEKAEGQIPVGWKPSERFQGLTRPQGTSRTSGSA